MTRRALSRGALLLGALLGFLSVLVATSPAASAHAALLSTTPGNNEIVGTSPAEVTLVFGEAVGTGLGSMRVLSATGERADTGELSRSDGDKVVHVPLRTDLATGSYAVLWRVVSADSHPVSGTFVFSVGKPTPLTGYQGRISPPRSPSLLLGLTRGLGFTALLVLLGGALFCLLLWPSATAGRPVRRLLRAAAALELLTAGAALLLQGPYAAGLGAGHALDQGLLSSVLDTQYGKATAARTAVAAVALLVTLLLPRLPRRVSLVALVLLGVGCAATWSAAGHAGTGTLQPYTFAGDVLHLVSVAAWVGGLVLLGVALRGAWSEDEMARRLPAWSRLATLSVLLLVVTGSFASWREVRSVAALGTPYGGILIAKIALVALMLGFGAVGRAVVRRRYTRPVVHAATSEATDELTETPEQSAAQLRRSTLIETVLAGVVLAVTAVLVQTPPAASAYAPPYTGISDAGPYKVQADVYPAHKGLNSLHIYTLGADGRTVDVAEVSGTLTRADGETLSVTTVRKSLGHYEVTRLVLPSTGTWTLTLNVRATDVDSYATTQTIPVR